MIKRKHNQTLNPNIKPSDIYATKTLGMLTLENIIEILPRRPGIEELDEVMLM